jgi:predicted enzyme related to lactoylglutathione lyase
MLDKQEAKMHGKFFWYDVMTTDTKAAQKFYGDVVGWGAQDSGTPGADYTLFTVNDRGVAGLMPIPEDARTAGARPCWMGYIAVDDVDQAAARLEREGGKVLRPPMDVPGVILFSVVADPQGAGFIIAKGLVQDAPPPLPAGTPGTVGWHELYAAEWKAAFAFYEKMFGWTKAEAIDMGPMGTYQLFATGDVPVGGMMTKPDMIPMPFWGYYFNVAGLDTAAARVTAGGGKIMNGPMQVPGGQWIVQCMDPQSAVFALVASQR